MFYKPLFLVFSALFLFARPISAAQEGTWAVRCQDDKYGRPVHCEMFQRLVGVDTGRRMAEFALGFPGRGSFAHGTLVLDSKEGPDPVGGSLRVDTGRLFTFEISHCTPEGCFALVHLEESLLDRMSSGRELYFKIELENGYVASFPMSLAGFSPALKELRGKKKPQFKLWFLR